MDILDATVATFVVDDDLLNFTLDGEEEDPIKNVTVGGSLSFSSSSSSLEASNLVRTTPFFQDMQSGSFPEVEEDLEWLSNKDAFPAVETCFGILNPNPEFMLNHESPVSVLENSSSFNSNNNGNGNGSSSSIASCCESLKVPTNFPVRARSKRSRSRRKVDYGNFPIQQCVWSSQVNMVKSKLTTSGAATMGRRCLHCQTDKTPQWRAGPMGPKTLCNACGVRYKSGRLLPEYRPASSPTFSSAMHSNSHRKVVEMRRQKQLPLGGGGGMVVN